MQADGVAVFSFFLPGSDVLELQTLAGLPVPTGVERVPAPGNQRACERYRGFLDSGQSSPNAIILALSPEVEFGMLVDLGRQACLK